MPLTEKQLRANDWLSRNVDRNDVLKQLIERQDDLIGTISKYDNTGVHGGSDSNPTESKNIEYCELCQQIERLQNEISYENVKTLRVVNCVEDPKLRKMLIAHYLNLKPWREVGSMYYYGKSRIYEYRKICLDAVIPYLPPEAFIVDNPFPSLKEWTQTDL